MPCYLVLVPQHPTRRVGIVVPQATVLVMGTTARALVLVSTTPVAQTVAAVMVVKVKVASLVVRLAATLVQSMP